MPGTNVSSKDNLASSFGRAAQDYDTSAKLQKIVGRHLLALSRQAVGAGGLASHTSCVMDLGCGTGYFSQSLVSELGAKTLLLTDISAPMLAFAQARVSAELSEEVREEPRSTDQKTLAPHVMCAQIDAELFPFTADSMAFVYSSLALQWVTDLKKTLAAIYDAIEPGGHLAFSTLLDGTLFELKNAWAGVDANQHVNEFMSLDACLSAISASGFSVVQRELRPEIIKYKKPIRLMKDLKSIGAHNIAQARAKTLTGKTKLAKVLAEYERYRDNDGEVPATYQVAYFVLKKENN